MQLLQKLSALLILMGISLIDLVKAVEVHIDSERFDDDVEVTDLTGDIGLFRDIEVVIAEGDVIRATSQVDPITLRTIDTYDHNGSTIIWTRRPIYDYGAFVGLESCFSEDGGVEQCTTVNTDPNVCCQNDNGRFDSWDWRTNFSAGTRKLTVTLSDSTGLKLALEYHT